LRAFEGIVQRFSAAHSAAPAAIPITQAPRRRRPDAAPR
jgi:hypothetical protein